jgi:cytochrome P450
MESSSSRVSRATLSDLPSAKFMIVLPLPPGPALSAEQQARLWIERPLELLDACARQFGDVFTLQLGALGATVIFSNPEAVRAIFRAPPELFECQHFNESYRFVMGDHALFLQDGEKHRRIKRVMAPPLCHDGIAGHVRAIRDLAQETFARGSGRRCVAVRPVMHEFALRVLMKMVFGARREAGEQVVGWFKSEVWRDQRAWKPWTNLSRLQPRLRATIAGELDYRRGCREPGRERDLLDYLLAARDEHEQPLEEAEIQDQILTLTITAVDPVAFALTWLLAQVGMSPEVQSAVRDELDALGDDPDPLEITHLPYLTATCQETLRIHPILPTVSGRRLTSPAEIGGHLLEKGVNLAPCAYLVHRRADLYPEPLAFRPDRFLARRFSPFEYFPFGGSNRHCLGTALAPLEMKQVLATIVARSRIYLDDPGVANVRYGTLVGPPGELKIGFEAQ